jgi:hypothetical protein
MIMLVVFGFLTGMLFGLRFTVLVLVPVIMLTWMLTISIDAMRGLGFWWVVLDMFVLSTALQFGYVAGGALAILRSALDATQEPSGLILPFSRPSECLVSLSIQNVPKDDPALKRRFRLSSIIRAPSIKTCSGSFGAAKDSPAPLPEIAPQSGSSRFATRAALVRCFSQLDIRSKAIGNNFLYDGLGIFPTRDIYCDFDSYANQRHPKGKRGYTLLSHSVDDST